MKGSEPEKKQKSKLEKNKRRIDPSKRRNMRKKKEGEDGE
jgi:hypothetical protein